MGAIGLGNAQGAAIIEPVELQRKGARQFAHRAVELATGQPAVGGPVIPHLAEPGFELVAGSLGQLAVGGELAAEHRQQRRAIGFAGQFQRVVARHRLRRIGLVVAQRAHPGVGPDHVFGGDLAGEVGVDHLAQVVDLGVADLGFAWAALVLHVGGANQRVVLLIRDDEDDAVVLVLQDISLFALMDARHYHVAALDEANAAWGFLVQALVIEGLDPGAGCIDQAAAGDVELLAPLPLQSQGPVFGAAHRLDAAGAGLHVGALVARHHGVEHHQPGVVDPGVRVLEPLADAGGEAILRQEAHAAAALELVALGQVVIEEQAGADHPGRTQVRAMGQAKTHGASDVRGHAEQHFPLRQRLFHQPEFVVFEIAQAAVDQLAGVGRGGRGEILRFKQRHLQPTPRRIGRDTDAVDAAADDDQIIMFAHVHLLSFL